jgi:hypothetical protein
MGSDEKAYLSVKPMKSIEKYRLQKYLLRCWNEDLRARSPRNCAGF